MWFSFKGDKKLVCWRALLGSRMRVSQNYLSSSWHKKRNRMSVLAPWLLVSWQQNLRSSNVVVMKALNTLAWRGKVFCSYCCVLFMCFSARYSKLNGICYLSSFWELFWITLLRIKKKIRINTISPPPLQIKTTSCLSAFLFPSPSWRLVYYSTVCREDPNPQWTVAHLTFRLPSDKVILAVSSWQGLFFLGHKLFRDPFFHTCLSDCPSVVHAVLWCPHCWELPCKNAVPPFLAWLRAITWLRGWRCEAAFYICIISISSLFPQAKYDIFWLNDYWISFSVESLEKSLAPLHWPGQHPCNGPTVRYSERTVQWNFPCGTEPAAPWYACCKYTPFCAGRWS